MKLDKNEVVHNTTAWRAPVRDNNGYYFNNCDCGTFILSVCVTTHFLVTTDTVSYPKTYTACYFILDRIKCICMTSLCILHNMCVRDYNSMH